MTTVNDAITPGPWRYQEDSDACTHIVRAGENHFICQLRQGTDGVAEANARLIAAAPELLAALKAVTEHMDQAGGDRDGMPECPWCKCGPRHAHSGDCELILARAVIAKAEGR